MQKPFTLAFILLLARLIFKERKEGMNEKSCLLLFFSFCHRWTLKLLCITDDLLQQMGLEQAGDRLSLKAFFVQKNVKEVKKRKEKKGEVPTRVIYS